MISATIVRPCSLYSLSFLFSLITLVRLSPGGASFNPSMGYFCPFCGTFCCPLWVVSNDLHGWTTSCGDWLVSLLLVFVGIFCFKWIYSVWISLSRSAMLRRQQVLEWLDLFFWQSICGLIPFQAKFLKRFNFESFVYRRLGVEFLKHYFIECPCRRIAWSSSPWITRFEFLFTSLDEVWPAYLLWS